MIRHPHAKKRVSAWQIYLLNPLHRDAELIQIVDSMRAEFDSRLLKHLRG
jgi:hypothetical protein